MNELSHIVSGIYMSRTEAEVVCNRLESRGIPRIQISLVAAGDVAGNAKMADDNEALKDVLVDGGIGTLVGTGLGGLAEVALIAANVTLFVASPLVAPLAMLGWGAALGALVGGAVGANKPEHRKDGKLSELVLDAIKQGHVVVVVNTRTEGEMSLARNVIGESLTHANSAA